MKNRKSFITGISSTYLKKNEIVFLKKNKPWGVILFSRNINNFNQTKKLINQIKSCFHDNKYPILIDEESFEENRLEHPQYTKPREFRGLKVPDVLLSGHHKNIQDWQLKEALKKTAAVRPDLLNKEIDPVG